MGLPLSDILKWAAELAVVVLGPLVTKQLRDRQVREAIAHVADAALVLVIQKARNGTIQNIAELVREVAAEVLRTPAAPKQLARNPALATTAAAAAVARAGIVPVQAVHVNPDGTLVPQTKLVLP